MKINYDKIADAMYLNLNRGKVARSVKMTDYVVVDYDKKKNVVGIEILNYSANQASVKELENNIRSGIPIEISSATPLRV